jgi:hypothetical protein
MRWKRKDQKRVQTGDELADYFIGPGILVFLILNT